MPHNMCNLSLVIVVNGMSTSRGVPSKKDPFTSTLMDEEWHNQTGQLSLSSIAREMGRALQVPGRDNMRTTAWDSLAMEVVVNIDQEMVATMVPKSVLLKSTYSKGPEVEEPAEYALFIRVETPPLKRFTAYGS